MKNKLFAVFIGLNMVSGLSYAKLDPDYTGYLNITITNASPNLCKLINYSVIHGGLYFASSIPEYIPPYTSANPIIIIGDFFPEEVELSYSCGENKSISFNSKMINHYFTKNELSGQIISANNMTADYQAALSLIDSRVGHIRWNMA
jgi:hypothetical protein